MIASLFPLGWAHYLAGGLIIGLGVALLYVTTGRLAGMSSVFSSSWSFVSQRPFFQQPRWLESRVWRLQMALGLVAGAGLWWVLLGPTQALDTQVPAWRLLLGGVDFSDLFITLKSGKIPGPYATLAKAQEAGAVSLNIGVFMNAVISFLIVAFAVFLLVKAINKLQGEKPAAPAAPTTKDCPYCFSTIAIKATRCPNCTSEIR